MQVIDHAVSKQLYQSELEKYYAGEQIQRKRGIFLLKAEFPDVILLFTANHLQPAMVVFAVKINFNNYDLEPPSVRFINPYTWENLKQLPVNMLRKIIHQDRQMEITPLAMRDETGLPFICLPGIREYHQHPFHSGDLWLLHRNKGGEGNLGFIIDKLYTYGISCIGAYQMNLQIQAPQVNLFIHPDQIPQ